MYFLCVSFRLLCDTGWPCPLCIFHTALWYRLTMFSVYLSDCSVMQVYHALCIFQTALWCRLTMFSVYLSDCSVMQVCSICTCDQDLKQALRATQLLTNIATYNLKGNSSFILKRKRHHFQIDLYSTETKISKITVRLYWNESDIISR